VADDGGRVLRRGLPIHVLHNAVDTSLFSPGDESAAASFLDSRASAPAPPNSLRVGLLATYARWKGQDMFLRAAAGALRSRPDIPFHFYVVGGPVYATANSQWTLEELTQLTDDLGISSHVSFLPFQTDMVSCYRALDIAVHASIRPEPFGLTIAEAMACGKAVVASRDSGAAELISPEEALTLPRVEVGPLAEAIIDLASHGDKRRRMGAAARAAAVEKFGREQMAHRALALYESLRRPA
jgi:glycosyltransferase involved in cell wall biosynthesis